jgi:hypothetical protein
MILHKKIHNSCIFIILWHREEINGSDLHIHNSVAQGRKDADLNKCSFQEMSIIQPFKSRTNGRKIMLEII